MRSLLHPLQDDVGPCFDDDGIGGLLNFLSSTFSSTHTLTRPFLQLARLSLCNMLASRARILPRLSPLARQATAARRFMADQPNLSPSSSPSTSRPAQPTPASAVPVAAPTTQPRPVASPQAMATPQQQPLPKMQDGYSGLFYLSLLGGLVVTAPIITYFYWEHRKTHMRQKKEAILSDIHARVGTPK